jgi:hypothetical protein
MIPKSAAATVLLVATLVAVVSARDYAGGWNDGSRLAAVESLVDRHTFVIDESIFFQGTQDKLFINGHYYSDKPPVTALLLAGVYRLLQSTIGLRARDRPDRFCYWMALTSAGGAYVAAVFCVFLIGEALTLPLRSTLALTASFALATVSLPYTCQVNGHIVLLAVACALYLNLVWLTSELGAGHVPLRRSVALGTLAGLGYTTDLAAGPLLLLCTLARVGVERRRWRLLPPILLAALPWVLLHQGLNYMIGGTLRPANAIPEYLTHSPFDRDTMTGVWGHATFGHLVVYALALLFGRRGFLLHNPTLLLAGAGISSVRLRARPEWPNLVHACAWAATTWLVYALFSNNYSGVCVSIRWFVPLLAPGYLALALLVRERPSYWADFVTLSGWGLVFASIMWWFGPWTSRTVPLFWFLQALLLASWAMVRAWSRRQPHPHGLSASG